MTKWIRNFLMDAALFLLLGANLMALRGRQAGLPEGTSTGHIIASLALAAACLVHIVWHWGWFQAVLAGKARGKIKLGMYTMVAGMACLAVASGVFALGAGGTGGFHNAVGFVAMLGMVIHSVKHLPWVVAATRRLAGGEAGRTGAGCSAR